MTEYDIAIVGAGPTGLACAIEAERLGLRSITIDKGTLVNTIVGYPTGMTFFSTPDLLELGSYPFTSPNFRPNRVEAIAYYRGVARASMVNLSLHNRVHGVESLERGGFYVRTDDGDLHARFVVIATGYFDHPNGLDVPGAELPKVNHYYREPYDYLQQQVLVIGGRNSAVETALDLYRNGAHVTMIHRGDRFGDGVKYWVRPDIENRIKKGEIGIFWNTEVARIEEKSVTLIDNRSGVQQQLPNDVVFAMVGYRPDVTLLETCGVRYDPETLIPEFNPSTFETNVPGLYIAGSVACGCKTWEIFIENGRQHAGVVVGEIDRRIQCGS